MNIMKEISSKTIEIKVAEMAIQAACVLEDDLIDSFEKSRNNEESPVAREVFSQLLENAKMAKEEMAPSCQDTGYAVLFVTLGNDVRIIGEDLCTAINNGVRKGYEDGYLRKSVVRDPIDRVNTIDNTPAVIHIETTPGDSLRIDLLAKGGGCENMSRVAMLKPADGIAVVKDFVVETAKKAGANPCPPIVLGVGVGGTFDKVTQLAKRALLREVHAHNSDPAWAKVEEELLERVNNLGIGPQGLGGRITALAVHVEAHPCHIASLPVAVNVDCHAHRHKWVIL